MYIDLFIFVIETELQVLLIPLTKVPLSPDSVTVSQLAQQQDPDTEQLNGFNMAATVYITARHPQNPL